MKLKKGFVLHNIGEEYMAVAAGDAAREFNGLIRNNETADFIFRMLLEDTTQDAIIDAMYEQYDAAREEIAADVSEIISRIREAGLLDE